MLHPAVQKVVSCLIIVMFAMTLNAAPSDPIWTLGIDNSSDSEFDQSNFDNEFVMGTDSVGDFPKELNTSWYDSQYIDMTLTTEYALNGIIFWLDPAWNDGSGALNINIELWDGSSWELVNDVSVNSSNEGEASIPSIKLKTGLNEFRIRAIDGSGSTTVVTWDQIIIAEDDNTDEIWSVGDRDSSDSEFDQSGYDAYFDADTDSASDFPKELNLSWYDTTYIEYDLTSTEAAAGVRVYLFGTWNDGTGNLSVRLDVDDGSSWVTAGSTFVQAGSLGTIAIPSSLLVSGTNDLRLVATEGTSSTTAVTWDQIRMMKDTSGASPPDMRILSPKDGSIITRDN